LEVLTKAGRPIDLPQFVRKLANGDDVSRRFVVTFDDGYKDTVDTAAPILDQYGVSATVFIPTAMIGKPFWWDEIQEIVEKAANLPDSIDLSLGGDNFRWERVTEAHDSRAALIHDLCGHFRSIPYAKTDEALGTLRELPEFPETSTEPVRAMTADEVVTLSRHELIEIGSHTVTHTSLSDLSPERQESEVRQSKVDLEALCGLPVESFAYPNGRVAREAPALLRQTGFSCGITSKGRPVSRSCNPYLLPRSFVGDWDGDQFSRWLGRWLG
jgi:peptidoglycan/xylan/chitin deacetylase (PgdA/CDA1 family)